MTFRPFPHKSLIPTIDDGYALGTSSLRWADGYIGPGSLHFLTTPTETGTQRDWNLGVVEVLGATRGNMSITENSTLQQSFDVNGNIIFHRNAAGISLNGGSAGSVVGSGTALVINLPSGGLLFNGGQFAYSISGGFQALTQSSKAWLRQSQANVVDARLIGISSGTVAGTSARAGSSSTDAQGANVTSLFEVCTDNTAVIPTTKFSFTGFQELSIDGYSTLPAYSYISDPDTGWYRSSSNTLAAATGATPKLFIGSNISTSTDLMPFIDDGYSLGSSTARWRDGYFAHNSLHVTSTAGKTGVATDWNLSLNNDGYFQVRNINDSYFSITRFGNIGIGITQPSEKLYVDGYVKAASGFKFSDDSLFVAAPQHAYKHIDESVTSSTTLQDDDALIITIPQTGIYKISASLFFSIDAGGVKIALNGTVAFDNLLASIDIVGSGSDITSGRIDLFGSTVSHNVVGVGSHHVLIDGTIEATSSGTLLIQWAQQTSDVVATIMKRGSTLKVSRII